MSARGVYAVLHVPTGAAYIGASTHVTNRYTWHRVMLRNDEHTSPRLQTMWNMTEEHEWVFVLVCFCRSRELAFREIEVMQTWPGKVLNDRTPGYRHSPESRKKMSLGRARYLKTPGAREKLSKNAKKQHRAGKLGRQTWKNVTVEKKP